MQSGRDAGLSTHIVGVNPQNFNVQMVAFDGGVMPANGDQYIVNGFPYNGMGFGYNPAGGGLTQMNASVNLPLALTPNAPSARAWSTASCRAA